MSSSIDQAAAAFVRGLSARTGNSRTDGVRYVLHSTTIAEKQADGSIRFNWGGWHTPTTANHMNAILEAAGKGFRVSYAQARDSGVSTFTA